MQDLISVVVITYNSEKTVVETLDSILNQSYQNIELIISDDASTDNTVDTVKKWITCNSGRFYKSLVETSDTNQGVVKNVNRGVSVSSGDYVQIIAGDDILLNDALTIKYHNSDEDKCIVVTKVKVFGEATRISAMEKICEESYKILKKDSKTQFKKLLINNYIVAPCWGFVPRKVYEQIGLYDERFNMIEDYPFLIKLLSNGYRFKFVDEVTALYRVHSASVSQSSANDRFRDSRDLFFVEEKAKLLLDNKMYYQYIWQSILSFRYHIGKKYGRRSMRYYACSILTLFNPVAVVKYFLAWVKRR